MTPTPFVIIIETFLATSDVPVLPVYDYLKWCSQQTIGNDDQRVHCVVVERRSLDKLLSVRTRINRTFLNQCDSDMRPVGSGEFSYAVLLSCVEIKMGAPF